MLWKGRNLINKHFGKVAIKDGWIEIEAGRLTAGEVTIDLTTISCDDLAGDDLHDVLIAHLHSDDFFDVERYPLAKYVITGSQEMNQGAPG